MSHSVRSHDGNATQTILWEIPGNGIMIAAGNTVPADTASGYAVGCIWIDTNGATGTRLYSNVGSNTSCNFDLITSA